MAKWPNLFLPLLGGKGEKYSKPTCFLKDVIQQNTLTLILKSKKLTKGKDDKEIRLDSYAAEYPITDPKLLERLKTYKILSNEQRDKLDMDVTRYVLDQSKALEQKAKQQLELSEDATSKLQALLNKHDKLEQSTKDKSSDSAVASNKDETLELNNEISDLMNQISHITQD